MKSWFKTLQDPLYACVHVPEFPAQALLRLRSHLHSSPVAVLDDAVPQPRICAVNAAGRREGLRNGMTCTEAESIRGSTLLPRSATEEENARTTMLVCAGSYSPDIETCHAAHAAGCVLSVAGAAHAMHSSSPQAFAQSLRASLRSHGLYASIAISANFHAACLLARAGPGITIAAPGEEQKALAPLLLHVLDLEEQQAETMARWGIRTLGGIAALPHKELMAGIGQSGRRLRELARGEHPHRFVPVALSPDLREQYTFKAPERLLEGLLFVLGLMLEQLVLRAAERALAIASVTITFILSAKPAEAEEEERTGLPESELAGMSGVSSVINQTDSRNLHLVAPMLASFRAAAQKKQSAYLPITAKSAAANNTHKRTVRPVQPTYDNRLLLRLLQFDLAAHPPASSVLGVVLEAEAQNITVKGDSLKGDSLAPLRS